MIPLTRTVDPLLALRDRSSSSSSALSRRRTVAVVVPTVDEVATIGQICRSLVGLQTAGVCDRVLVVDASADGTAEAAIAAGAEVLAQRRLRPEFGSVQGKGDAMWRALSVVREDITVFVDGDTVGFDPAMVVDLIAAIDHGAAFAKASYRRPWRTATGVSPTGGGRVTELAAKPLLRRLFPELAMFDQPLAGEVAARTNLLRRLPFVTGYGVDVALLIDAWREVRGDGLVQVPCGPRQNRHRPLEQLAGMSDEVIGAILTRAGVAGEAGAPPVERPPAAQASIPAVCAA